jgi:hypothetical protein
MLGARPGRVRILVVMAGVLVLFVATTLPVSAAITSVSPGSAHVLPGGSVGVSVTTDQAANVALAGGSAPNVSVSPQAGAGPTVRFTFVAFSTAIPGTYRYTFTDGAGTGSFTLIVDAPTVTTITTAPPTTTATTKPKPTTTTTTRAATTTTVPPATTTTEPPPTTTSTLPPTTTSTTTTLPPTTTSSTLVPAGIAVLGEGGDGGGTNLPFGWIGGGGVLFAALVAGGIVAVRRWGAPASGAMLAMRQRSERRRVAHVPRSGGASRVSLWWRTSGPLVSFREWRSSRSASATMRRQLEERDRLRRRGS